MGDGVTATDIAAAVDALARRQAEQVARIRVWAR